MDKLDFCLIPFVYLFQMTFTLLSLALFLATYFPTYVMKALKNIVIWIAMICIHVFLLTLSALHRLVQIKLIQFILNFVLQSSVVRAALFWPSFYHSILKPKENRRSLWEMLKNLIHQMDQEPTKES